MKSHRRLSEETSLASGDNGPRFLTDLPPSRRAMALFAFKHKHRGIPADEAAGRIGAILGLQEEIEAEDFDNAILARDASLARIFDADALALLCGISAKWQAPLERVLVEGLRAIQHAPPSVEIIYDTISIQL